MARRSALAALLALGAGLAAPSILRAQQGVPQLLDYRGRVIVGGVNFSGQGQFKFALVNAAGTITYWSNDGSSANGSQPASAVTLPVANGLYSLLLGDSSLGNMTPIPPSVFANADVRLRVWFNDGASGSQRLSLDQRVAAVGYALTADGVRAGGVTGAMIAVGAVQSSNLANGAVGSSQLASGAVGASQLAGGAVAANLGASGQSAVASGGLILSPAENPALLAAGYVRIGTTLLPDGWRQPAANVTPLAARRQHVAVWTGAEMIVWGGRGSSFFNDGARFNVATNLWTPLPTTTLAGRYAHTAVWTGGEMIVWGGQGSGNTLFNNGARYNLGANAWTALPATTLAARSLHATVWTGVEMIVWGGSGNGSFLNDGARYNPTSNAWSLLRATTLAGRLLPTAVWTGGEMIVWGGQGSTSALNDGARYDGANNAWTLLPTTTLAGRYAHTAVWTGTDMIVWGGLGGGLLNDGARFNPTAGAWTVLPAPAIAGRYSHTAVWTGSDMIVWGGFANAAGSAALADGARYSAASNAWTTTTAAGAPAPRGQHTAVWTGTEMDVWGGYTGAAALNDLFSYTPGRVAVLYQRP